jgi:hypothetical protein
VKTRPQSAHLDSQKVSTESAIFRGNGFNLTAISQDIAFRFAGDVAFASNNTAPMVEVQEKPATSPFTLIVPELRSSDVAFVMR